MTIVIETNSKSRTSFQNFCSARKVTVIAFAIIPLVALLIYGIEDKNADFFAKSKYPDDYRAIYHKNIYNIGIMVSQLAKIATISIVGILISWIIIEILKTENILKSQKKDYVISK